MEFGEGFLILFSCNFLLFERANEGIFSNFVVVVYCLPRFLSYWITCVTFGIQFVKFHEVRMLSVSFKND